MAALLAIVTAALWGTSDFFGGLASKKQSVTRVMMWAHGIGLVAVAAVAPFLSDSVQWRDLWLGAIAGIVGLVGLLLLYQSLSIGPMAVVAPLSALTAALLPVLWELPGSEGLSTATLIGLGLGLAAVIAISWEPSHDDGAPSLTPQIAAASVLAGMCFGSILLIFDATSDESAPWPVVGGRLTTTILLVGYALVRKQPLTPGPAIRHSAIAGLGDTFANVTLIFATTVAVGASELSVVAVITAFFPAATVIWARFALGEQLGRIRLIGLGLGLSAIALMTIG